MNIDEVIDLVKKELESNKEVIEWGYDIGPDDEFPDHPNINIWPKKTL